MPPRLITGAIIAFWLTMTGLLIHREVVPMMLAEVSPHYQPDLTDEIGSPLVGWTVLHEGKRIGSATSKVTGNDDGSYEFRSTFHFDKLALGPEKLRINIRLMENTYRVTETGKLLAVSTKVAAHLGGNKEAFAPPDITIGIEGEVVNDIFEPRVILPGFEHKLDKIHLRQEGSIVNPMHLVSRLRGLRPGQTWKVKRIDAFQALTEKLMADFGKNMNVPALIAEVKTDTLTWDKREVVCNVIEYWELGKEVTARTWVRRSDGLVLQQEASFGFEVVLQRVPH